MAYITKEKNLFAFTSDEGKTYYFNTSTGELLGLRGKPLRSCPNFVSHLIADNEDDYNSLMLMSYFHRWRGASYASLVNTRAVRCLDIAERLESIEYRLTRGDCDFLSNACEVDFLEYCQKNFKKLSKFIRETDEQYYVLQTFRDAVTVEALFTSAGIKVDEHFTEPMANYIARHTGIFSTPERVKAGSYFLARGLWSYYENNYYELNQKLSDYFNYCDCLEWNPKQKGSFLELYVRAKETYRLNKENYDNKQLEKNQMRFADYLNFEYGDLQVIVPTTCKEFADEAEAQQICVYRMYLPRCIEGKTNVVFIRRKSNLSHSYITCEVNNRGEIQQFLRAYNRSPWLEEDCKFEREYQKHLEEVWDR